MHERKRRPEDWTFWLQVRSALYRAGALFIFLLVHKLLNVTLEWTVPHSLIAGVLLLESIAFGAFAVIYAALVVEMVVVFVPALRRRMYPREQEQENRGEYANRGSRDQDAA